MSDILQAENKRTGGALDLKTAFNASAPATLPGEQDPAVSRIHAEQDREKADILERSRRLPGDPDALGGLRGLDVRASLRTFFIEAKKKKDNILRLIAAQSLQDALKEFQDFCKWMKEEADKWQDKAAQTLDLIDQYNAQRIDAQDAFDKGDTKRRADGHFENKGLDTMLLVALKIHSHGTDPAELSDQEARELVQWALDNPGLVNAGMADVYRMEQAVAEVLAHYDLQDCKKRSRIQ